MRIFKSFCENNSGKGRILQEYTEKGSLFGEPSFLSLLSFDFYLHLLSFYPSISIFVVLVFLLYFQEVLFEFLPRHVGCVVVVQVMVDAGDVLHVVEHLGYIVAHDDDGALLVDLL